MRPLRIFPRPSVWSRKTQFQKVCATAYGRTLNVAHFFNILKAAISVSLPAVRPLCLAFLENQQVADDQQSTAVCSEVTLRALVGASIDA